MRDRRVRARVLTAALVLCLVCEAIVLAWPEEKTEDDGWIGRGMTSEIAGDTTFEALFSVTASNFRAIRFYAHKAGAVASGTAHLTLWQLRRDDEVMVDQRTIPVAALVSGDHFDYRFRPQPLSTHGRYRFQLSVPDARPGEGILVEIMRRQYRENPSDGVTFGGRGLWGALRFTADIDRPSMLARLVTYLRKGFFGRATLFTFAACWIGLHVLALRVLSLLLDDAYAPA